VSDLRHWKISLGERGYFTRIEVDGVRVENVVALKVEVGEPSESPTIGLTILPSSVEIEGDVADSQIVGLLLGTKAVEAALARTNWNIPASREQLEDAPLLPLNGTGFPVFDGYEWWVDPQGEWHGRYT
jgi:hypothetical protein